jgi:hypothetical protein
MNPDDVSVALSKASDGQLIAALRRRYPVGAVLLGRIGAGGWVGTKVEPWPSATEPRFEAMWTHADAILGFGDDDEPDDDEDDGEPVTPCDGGDNGKATG